MKFHGSLFKEMSSTSYQRIPSPSVWIHILRELHFVLSTPWTRTDFIESRSPARFPLFSVCFLWNFNYNHRCASVKTIITTGRNRKSSFYDEAKYEFKAPVLCAPFCDPGGRERETSVLGTWPQSENLTWICIVERIRALLYCSFPIEFDFLTFGFIFHHSSQPKRLRFHLSPQPKLRNSMSMPQISVSFSSDVFSLLYNFLLKGPHRNILLMLTQ